MIWLLQIIQASKQGRLQGPKRVARGFLGCLPEVSSLQHLRLRDPEPTTVHVLLLGVSGNSVQPTGFFRVLAKGLDLSKLL